MVPRDSTIKIIRYAVAIGDVSGAAKPTLALVP